MDDRDVPGVIALPPLIFGLPLLAGMLLGRVLRDSDRARLARERIGEAMIVGGIAIGAAGYREITRAGSNTDPRAPATALVTSGPYRYTRNPMYLGMTSIYLGSALRARSILALAILPIVLGVVERGVIDREEDYLTRRFGDRYTDLRARVPRWL